MFAAASQLFIYLFFSVVVAHAVAHAAAAAVVVGLVVLLETHSNKQPLTKFVDCFAGNETNQWQLSVCACSNL